MNLKQALYIRTVAQEGSVTQAAKKLYVSQPSLSQMIRQVESEYGVTLFDRTVSPLRLTYAGEKYLEAANIMLTANNRLENELREIRQENSGLLRLGISVQRAIQILPVALPWFTMQYPKVSVDLREEGSARLEELLEAGEIDLALAAVESVSPALSFTLIEKEVIGVLAGKNSAIANQLPPGTPINLNMIREDAFVSLKPGHSVRVVQDTLFHAEGIKPQILLETDSLEVAKRVAIQAGACMLCSDIFMDEYARRGGVFFPLMGYENKRHLYACWRKDEKLPRYAVGFIQIVTRILDKNTPRL